MTDFYKNRSSLTLTRTTEEVNHTKFVKFCELV